MERSNPEVVNKNYISDEETFNALTDDQLLEFIFASGEKISEYDRLMDIASRILEERGIDIEIEIKKKEI